MDRPDTREWLTTNGLGGYASGTACGAQTRRYHGLLVAALDPPAQRTMLLSRIDETVAVGSDVYDLGANFWRSGALAPEGFRHLTAFRTDPVPTWEYQVGAGRLVKRVACLPGQNAVAISYRLEGGPPVRLELKVLANSRDFHGDTHGDPDWHFRQDRVAPNRLRVAAWDGAPAWSLTWASDADAEYQSVGHWYWGYAYPEEAARGLASLEDNYCVGLLRVRLAAGTRVDLWASAEEPAGAPVQPGWPTADDLADADQRRRQALVAQAGLPATHEAALLVAAADQFLVRRASTDGPTVIAGYHWFADWGRDTMIALPGLTLTTRRFAEARGILRTVARSLDRGMLPNQFPDQGRQPEYNTVDATLWWFHALDQYHRAIGDDDLLREQFPLLADVVDWHVRGTRHGIQVDPDDGLLLAGAPSQQLTWMDARIGDWVVTPRDGKPVEVNALWLHALTVMTSFADRLGLPQAASRYRQLAGQARAGMQRFWSAEHGYLFDVIGPACPDRGGGVGDPSLRPNQLFAFSLPTCAFTREQGEAVLHVVQARLLTPYGLRSLAPDSPGGNIYAGRYAGDAFHRDSVYHQGTVWPWLLGAYADALVNIRGWTPATVADLRQRIGPLLRHLTHDACLGSISEIFDGDPPHAPQGAVAQAWSVAELLRIYALIAQVEGAAGPPPAG